MELVLPPRENWSAEKSIPSNFNAGPPALTATTRSPLIKAPLEELLDELLEDELLEDELLDDELLDDEPLPEDELLLEELLEEEPVAPSPPHAAKSRQLAKVPRNGLRDFVN